MIIYYWLLEINDKTRLSMLHKINLIFYDIDIEAYHVIISLRAFHED